MADGEPYNGWIGSADEDDVPEADLENGLSEPRDSDPGNNDPVVEDAGPDSKDPVVEDTSPPSKDLAVEDVSPDSKVPEVTDGVTGSQNEGLDDDDDDDDERSDNSSKDKDVNLDDLADQIRESNNRQ